MLKLRKFLSRSMLQGQGMLFPSTLVVMFHWSIFVLDSFLICTFNDAKVEGDGCEWDCDCAL